jgi:hypothetical protein
MRPPALGTAGESHEVRLMEDATGFAQRRHRGGHCQLGHVAELEPQIRPGPGHGLQHVAERRPAAMRHDDPKAPRGLGARAGA